MASIFAIIAGVAIIAVGFLLRLLLRERATSDELALAVEDHYLKLENEKKLRQATRRQLGVARIELARKRRESHMTNVFLQELIRQNPDIDLKLDRNKARELFLN